MNFPQSAPDQISLTSEIKTALHWATEAAKATNSDQAYVYLVEPEQDPEHWRSGPKNHGRDVAYYESRCDSAQVISIIFGEGIEHLPGDVTEHRIVSRNSKGQVCLVEHS